MPTADAKETKGKIISTIKIRGPSLPVNVANQAGISTIFAGAFLSELANEKMINISNMKVGGSPLYFIPGQEPLLDNFYSYLPGKEKEAFLRLKENKILEDRKQEPPIRVALRSIKDFAHYFLKDNELFWRFHTVTEEEVRSILEPKKEAEKIEPIVTTVIEKPIIKPAEQIKEKLETPAPKIKKVKKTEVPVAEKPQEKPVEKKIEPRPKEKSPFSIKIAELLKKENIEILEEKDSKRNEFSGVVKIDSVLGKIKFFCIAKNKKTISEDDLRITIQKSQALRMPALVLYQKEPNKKTLEYAEKWASLLRLKKIW